METPLLIVFIRGLHGFVVGRLGFYLFSFPGPSCFCFNSIGEKVKPSPSLKPAELEIQVGRMAPYRSSARLGPSLTLSSLMGGARLTVGLISSRVSILELITVQGASHPQNVPLETPGVQLLLGCHLAKQGARTYAHVFTFHGQPRSLTQPRHSQTQPPMAMGLNW